MFFFWVVSLFECKRKRTFYVECVALKILKSLSFVSKEKFLESDGVKSNHENIIKKAAATLRCSEKQMLLKRIKAAI